MSASPEEVDQAYANYWSSKSCVVLRFAEELMMREAKRRKDWEEATEGMRALLERALEDAKVFNIDPRDIYQIAESYAVKL